MASENETTEMEGTERTDAQANDVAPTEGVPDDMALDVFSAGVESATPPPDADTDTEGDAPAAADARASDASHDAQAQGADAAADPADDKAATADPAAKKDGAPDPDVEKEIEGLGLKEKSAERFREMATTLKTTSAELEGLKQDAARGMEWERMVLDSTATPEQFSAAMQVLRGANSGDPATKSQAFDAMVDMLREMGKDLGRDIPGLVDPLAEHRDLAQAVEEGEMTRERAVEVAQARALKAFNDQRSASEAESSQFQQAVQVGTQQVQQLAAQLRQSDPDFERKLPYLHPALEAIQNGLPPAQWAAAVANAYRALPTLPAAPAPAAAPAGKVPVSAAPLRATGTSRGMRREPKTDLEAFEMGMASVGP